MTFHLYGQSQSGVSLWSETHVEVPVEAGAFVVVLGTLSPFPALVGDELYLAVEVDGDAEFQPRMRVGGALRARFADLAALAEDATGRDIQPRSVSAGQRLIIDEAGRWVGEPIAGVGGNGVGTPGPQGPQGEPGRPDRLAPPVPKG